MRNSNTSQHFGALTISALAEVITGGAGNTGTAPIGRYRSAYYLKQFFLALNISFDVAGRSRVPAVEELLTGMNREAAQRDALIRIIEAVADARDYIDDPEKLTAVVVYMNKRLVFDGFELRQVGMTYRVVATATNAVAASALREKAKALDLSSVHSDFDRALSQADSNPSGAITAACSTVESVCKCILDEMSKPYPTNKDIKGLAGEVAKHINLSPGRDDLPKEWEQDIRTILSGLFNVIGGIGSLRTHAGDAHGKGKNPVPADPRIARLAIHAANTVSLFYIETWQKVAGKSKVV